MPPAALAVILKALGIDPQMLFKVASDAKALVENYDRKIDRVLANQALIMEALNVRSETGDLHGPELAASANGPVNGAGGDPRQLPGATAPDA